MLQCSALLRDYNNSLQTQLWELTNINLPIELICAIQEVHFISRELHDKGGVNLYSHNNFVTKVKHIKRYF